jgi:hypothetical protein
VLSSLQTETVLHWGWQGKGANTPFILESRGLSRAETMSSLLERHEGIKDLMDKGELVPDTMVSIV